MKNNKHCVYKHTAPNGKVYIGQTQQNPPEKRWLYGKGYHCNAYFTNAINKYGWNNFQHEIIADKLTKEEADEMEIRLIAEYNSADKRYGYNIALGGNGFGTHSEESRKKMSESHAGKKLTEEHKKHIREASRRQNEETRKKKSLSHIGLKHSEETKRKMSEIQKARTQKEINDIYKKASKQVLCVETGVVYDSTRLVERLLGIDCSQISRVCNGKAKTAGGYHWQFYNEDVAV